jgi:putative MATE family efflux protein
LSEAGDLESGCLPRQPETAGVALLRGDPKTAIIRLSAPMIAAMLLMSSYNVVNAIWVAGLGANAMAAIGFVTPLFMILMGLGSGLGAGVTSTIARRIGACDRTGANNAAVHALLLVLGIAAVITVPFVLLAEPIAVLFGAGATAGLAAEYARIIFAGTVLFLFVNVGYAVLRAEGDSKRTMYAMVASSLLNLVLDPVLIYWAGLGIAGAAWGAVISIGMVTGILLYWFFVKRDTYLGFGRADFVPDWAVVRDMLRVGLPASLEFGLMSALAIIVNWMLVATAGTDAVAVYTAGWRVALFAVIPIVAIGTSVVSVAGAAYGARQFAKLRVAHRFATAFGFGIGLALGVITFVFADSIALIFTYAPESAPLAPMIAAFLSTMCFFFPFVAPGIVSGSIFQGTGKGVYSLVVNLFRNLVFIVISAYLLAFVFGLGEVGVWWGIVLGNMMGGTFGFLWARFYVDRLIRLAGGEPAAGPLPEVAPAPTAKPATDR